MPVIERNERKNYYIKMGGVNFGFRSPSALYGSIKGDLGVNETRESGNGRGTREIIFYGQAGENLPRLRLKLSGGGLANTGIANQAQSDGNDSALVFVAPDKLNSALTALIGKTARGKRISGVKIPKRRVYV